MLLESATDVPARLRALPATVAVLIALVLLAAALAVGAMTAPKLVLTQVQAVVSDADRFPVDASAVAITLPDDWSEGRPRFGGSVWYRSHFDRPAGAAEGSLLALYIERACTSIEVQLNGRPIHVSGRLTEPVTRSCHYPQLVTLPSGLLKEQGNLLDIRVVGPPSTGVAARQRAGGLSALVIGPYDALAEVHARQAFANVGAVQASGLVLAVLGVILLGLGWLKRSEAYLGYFGALALAWVTLSAGIWWRDAPLDGATVEFLVCAGVAPVLALAVQFLLSYAGLRSRISESVLFAQCLVLPFSLVLAGPSHLFDVAEAWYWLLAAEALAAIWIFLRETRRQGRSDFLLMALVVVAAMTLVLVELGIQRDWLALPPTSLLQVGLSVLFIAIAARLLLASALALRTAESHHDVLEQRVREATREVERNFAQLSDLRIEQVTTQERKRIAADLHDDLGAKLLTIVHTSESERISTLAREALEEMRLSVRGLTGKPVRLADALADWRAETVSRLGQANIEAEWQSPAEEGDQLLPARSYVQTTRILREAVSNIIKHSRASHCTVRCAIQGSEFRLTVQDNGRGIPMEMDGKLDRGHGMASMKHRAKQMQGQCLVESGPGYGTVIRLTLPLHS
jgi:signal transduction histidine kinase